MPPKGIANRGDLITDPEEGLIRRGRRNREQKFIQDQVTGKCRLPVAVFEPRLPENRPKAKHFDKYLSVNIESSLKAAGLANDWNCDHKSFYAARLELAACAKLDLQTIWEPDEPENPHHGAIKGLVEMYYQNPDRYEKTITALAKSASVIPESLASGNP